MCITICMLKTEWEGFVIPRQQLISNIELYKEKDTMQVSCIIFGVEYSTRIFFSDIIIDVILYLF